MSDYYAVTDQFCIIPLHVVSREHHEMEDTKESFTVIETEIDGEVKYKTHCDAHWEIYFKEFYIIEELPPSNIFETYEEAEYYKITRMSKEISRKKHEYDRLIERFMEEINDN